MPRFVGNACRIVVLTILLNPLKTQAQNPVLGNKRFEWSHSQGTPWPRSQRILERLDQTRDDGGGLHQQRKRNAASSNGLPWNGPGLAEAGGSVWRPASSWLAATKPLTLPGLPRANQTAPPATNTTRKPETPVDGTWRDDGRFVIINLGGRQVRLAKEGSDSGEADHRTILRTAAKIVPNGGLLGSRPADGTVSGRLLNGRRPLVECRVSLIPLRRTRGQYEVNAERDPHSAVTNEHGDYRFENVQAGPYKLFWLPKGRRRWIRRIQYRPDVVIHSGESSQIKDIRLSLRTVN